MAVRVGGSRRRFESAVRVGGSDQRFESAVRISGSSRRFGSAVRVGGSGRRFGSVVRIGGSDRWFGSVVRIGGSDRWFGSVVRIGGSSRPLLSRGRADASCRRSALTIQAGKPSRGREPAIQTRETPCVRAAFRPCSPRAHVARTRLEASLPAAMPRRPPRAAFGPFRPSPAFAPHQAPRSGLRFAVRPLPRGKRACAPRAARYATRTIDANHGRRGTAQSSATVGQNPQRSRPAA
ncbi:hypothetical protein BMAGB8_A0641 [Burkholderia mallei GB8 horse 4]|nr:hypothetical protein BMAFMH_I0033 [Burkholderia mallei FMH]EEP88458.1 hypothetical protein BMAGB8_A0641 [Burkholderia mallei GB8 horse 4]